MMMLLLRVYESAPRVAGLDAGYSGCTLVPGRVTTRVTLLASARGRAELLFLPTKFKGRPDRTLASFLLAGVVDGPVCGGRSAVRTWSL